MKQWIRSRRLGSIVVTLVLMSATAAPAAATQVLVVGLPGEQTDLAPNPSGIVVQTATTTDGSTDLVSVPWSGVSATTDVASGSGSQLSPTCSGSIVAYVDRSDPSAGGDPEVTTAVKVVDLVSGTRKTLSASTGFKTSPSCSGRYVAWTESTGTGDDVMMVDLDTDADGIADFLEPAGPTTPAPTVLMGGSGDQYAAACAANGFTWLDRSTGDTRVLFRPWDAAAPVQVLAENAGYKQAAPSIGGQIIAWKQLSGDGVTADIAMRDLVGGTTTTFGAAAGSHDEQPFTDGSSVVWVATSASVYGGSRQVWLRTADGTISLVAGNAADQSMPRIFGGKIVWIDARYDGGDVAIATPGVDGQATAVVITTASQVIDAGQTVAITGNVTDNRTGLAGLRVVLQSSADNVTFADTGLAATTGTGGAFSIPVSPAVKTYYRTRVAEQIGYASSVSSSALISPRVAISAPSGQSTMWSLKAKVFTGQLSPRHAARADGVRLYRWRKESGVWKAYGHVNASVTDSGVSSAYSASLSFPSTGTWRVRAYHPEDSEHAETWSADSYVTVKDVWIGTPKAPKTMKPTRASKVYGYLKPRHASGSRPVRIYRWRKVAGRWKAYGYVTATVGNYSTYSKYTCAIRLSRKGSWRLRAYHPSDATHRARWSSSYDYVRVQ